jgi:hypothetical protein
MLEEIIEIGEKILAEQDIIDSRIIKVNVEDDKGNPKKIVIIDFDTANKKVNFKVKEMDEDTVSQYLNLGRDGGPNANQWYVTFTNSVSLTSEVVSQLAEKEIPADIKEKLNLITDEFYYDFGEDVTPKYRYMLDLYKIGVISESLKEIYEKYKEESKPYKEVQSYLQKELQKYLEKSKGAKKKANRALYS